MAQTRLHKHSLSKKEQAVSGVASCASVRDRLDEFQDVYGSRAGSAAFRQQLGSDFSPSPQIQPPIQAKPSFRGLSQELAAESQPVQLREDENKTGLPDDLKAGVEALSGFSLDDVRVHYNSSKPSQLQALAYTQGTEIHVGPGQEKHLAHEAWHVVQQMQGRVKNRTHNGVVRSNKDETVMLEKEAEEKSKQIRKIELRSINQHIILSDSVILKKVTTPCKSPVLRKTCTNLAIAKDLAHEPIYRSTLFSEATLKHFNYPDWLNSDFNITNQTAYADILLSNYDLCHDPHVDYHPLSSVRTFDSNQSQNVRSYLLKSGNVNELMYVLKGKNISFAQKKDNLDIHPRLIGGNPDVDMAGTVNVNLEQGGQDALLLGSEFFDEDKWQGTVEFTNSSGHFQPETVNDEQRKILEDTVLGESVGDASGVDISVYFKNHKTGAIVAGNRTNDKELLVLL